MAQLHMVRDFERFPVQNAVVPAGFVLEHHGLEAVTEYMELRNKTGWGNMPDDFLSEQVLPQGLVFCRNMENGEVAASATAEITSFGSEYAHLGSLGQVMCVEAYKGLHLGSAVCVEAASIVAANGYRYIGLLTDDFRVPALRIYLKYGWRPWMIDSEMPERWSRIYADLGIDVDPGDCYSKTFFDK